MEIASDRHRYVVGVVGGATAGSAAAEVFANHGVVVLIFEQNDRPYGKIEDGLPRWHTQQRRNEYERIDARLNRPGIFFVPRTRLGRDLDFDELTQEWGLSAVLLANGAWKDRPLPIPGADDYLGRGLVYQNPLIYWFNHKNEAAYTGPRYEIPEGTLVIGGGLASIDVIKVVQLEIYERALRSRGIEVTMFELEHKGIGELCAAHGLDPATLGVRDGILVYRRRVEDMPLASVPKGAPPEKIQKVQEVRRRILTKARDKYRFEFQELLAPAGLVIQDGRLAGIRFHRTRVEGSSVKPVPGSELEILSDLTVSSIGSIPEPLPGVQANGEYYRFDSEITGQYSDRAGVFGAGNVVTGKGNIRVSLEHGVSVAHHVVEQYLGIADREPDFRYLPVQLETLGQEAAEAMLQDLTQTQPLPGPKVMEILDRVRSLQKKVGFAGDYPAWIRRVTPPDLE
jgi:NADPH-dependent glutamate synthase beta subunit-like oxidoreductase